MYKNFKISDIANLKYGKMPDKKKVSKEGYPIFTGYRVSGYYPEYNIEENTLVVVARGVGGTGDVKFVEEKSYLTNLSICLDLKDDKVNKKYLFYLLNYSNLRILDSGSAQSQITIKDLSEFTIELPTLDYQNQIANLLSSFDHKIENNNAIIANLEEQAQTIFKSWFVDMPKGSWTKGTVSDLGEVVAGGTPAKKNSEYYINGDIPWITPKDLSKINRKFVSKGATDITSLGLSKSSAKLVPRGTVLFSSRAPIGYIAIAKNDVSTNQGFKSIVPYENIGTPYVYYFLKNQTELIENMASGSTFKEISGSAMKKVPAAIPDKETLKEFNSFCQTLFLYQENLELQNEKLVEIRDTLLPKLMSGEIRVGEVIIEE